MSTDLNFGGALHHAVRRPSDARFVAALAVSVTVHLTTLAVLGDTIGGRHHGAFSWSAAIDRPLEVVVAPPRVAAESEARSDTALEIAASAFSVATAKDSVPPPPAVAPRQPVAKPLAEPEGVARGLTPHVIVNDRVARARFGEALDGDVLAQFPVEVDAGIVLPGKLEIPYPPGALAARREDAVLVWAIVDAQGAVEETHVVEGTPEFAEAVEAALSEMRFAPAHDLGQNIRYYITLEFEFRIEGAGAPVAAPDTATPESR